MLADSGGGGGDSVFTPPPGSPGSIRSAAGRLRSSGASTSRLASSARSAQAEVSGTWVGTAADGFDSFAGRVARLGSGFSGPIGNAATAVEGYADDLDTAQKKIAAAKERYDKANAAAQSISDRVNADPNRTQADVDAAQHQVDKHNDAAQAAVDDAQAAWASYNTAAAKASTALTGIAEETKDDEDSNWLKKTVENTEPYRDWNEKFHSVWEGTGLGAWLSHLTKLGTKGSKEAETLLEGLKNERQGQQILVDFVKSALAKGEDVAPALLKDAGQAAKDLGDSKDFLQTLETGVRSAQSFEKLEGVLKGVDGLGIAGDVLTIIDPEDKGAMGNVDRAVAGVNGGLLAANLVLDEIPGVGEVAIAATGAYLAGDYLYHHWGAFHDACDYVGGHVADYAVDTGHAVASAYNTVASGASDLASSAKDGLGKVAHGIGSLF